MSERKLRRGDTVRVIRADNNPALKHGEHYTVSEVYEKSGVIAAVSLIETGDDRFYAWRFVIPEGWQ